MTIGGLALRLGVAALLGSGVALPTARGAALVAPPRVEIRQHLGVALPLALPFTDATGRSVRLGDYFGDGRPVVLVLGYHRCPNLCGLVMHGVLEALDAGGLPRREWRIVVVSIDPEETPADARARASVYADYASFLRAGQATADSLDLHLLVGDHAPIAALSERVGFGYEQDRTSAAAPAGDAAAAASRYAHAAGIVVVTPEGRTSRYLLGVRFDPRELRLALVDAASGRIGVLSDRLLLLCAHFAPSSGRYAGAVLNFTRGVAVLSVIVLGGWAWRHRRAPARGASP
ncbi:MAG TPA: SCO family protein [Caldimonas sp.]|nr:SCO family protein [Caldimonas sp.]